MRRKNISEINSDIQNSNYKQPGIIELRTPFDNCYLRVICLLLFAICYLILTDSRIEEEGTVKLQHQLSCVE